MKPHLLFILSRVIEWNCGQTRFYLNRNFSLHRLGCVNETWWWMGPGKHVIFNSCGGSLCLWRRRICQRRPIWLIGTVVFMAFICAAFDGSVTLSGCVDFIPWMWPLPTPETFGESSSKKKTAVIFQIYQISEV